MTGIEIPKSLINYIQNYKEVENKEEVIDLLNYYFHDINKYNRIEFIKFLLDYINNND